MDDSFYYNKYLKYKNKYLMYKNKHLLYKNNEMIGGGTSFETKKTYQITLWKKGSGTLTMVNIKITFESVTPFNVTKTGKEPTVLTSGVIKDVDGIYKDYVGATVTIFSNNKAQIERKTKKTDTDTIIESINLIYALKPDGSFNNIIFQE
jgi:hypothetical protein